MEFPLNTLAARAQLRERLQAEGESLVMRMQAESWFQSDHGTRLAARFLSHRLESMSWNLDALRMQPWLNFAEALCPGVTSDIPIHLLAFACNPLKDGESCFHGDAYRDVSGGRWLVEESLPWGKNWQLPHKVNQGLIWPAGSISSGGDICSLYQEDGQPQWALLAWASALRGGNGSDFRIVPWVGCQSDTLRFVRNEWIGFRWCGWRLWKGCLPQEWSELRFSLDSDHPFARLPGFMELDSLLKNSVAMPAIVLRADDTDRVQLGKGYLTAASSDTPWQRLAVNGCTFNRPSTLDLPCITDIISRWGRWVFEGACHREFPQLLPRLNRLELLECSLQRLRFRLLTTSWSPRAWDELGLDLAKIQVVLRRCAWLGGNPVWEQIPWEFHT